MLDQTGSGENIYFGPGKYEDTYYIRASRETALIYAQGPDDSYNNKIDEENLINLDELTINGRYHYVRTMSDMEFRADKEALFTGIFEIENQYSPSSYDPVRQIEIDNSKFTEGYTSGYGNHVRIDGLVFNGFRFQRDGYDASFRARYLERDTELNDKISDLEFINCSFSGNSTQKNSNLSEDEENEGGYDGQRAIFLNADDEEAFNGIRLINCTFDTLYQGIYGYQINGFTSEGCTFSNFGHNAIALQNYQSGEPAYSKGKILIKDNDFINVADGVIGRGGFKDADITITENRFQNSGDKDGLLIKLGADNANQHLTNVSITCSGNSYNDLIMKDTALSNISQNGIKIDNQGNAEYI